MKPEKILYAMNDIDTAFLDEAREAVPRRSKRKFAALIAAVITLMALTVTAFAAEEIESWFQSFLSTKHVPQSWLDANEMGDYTEELLTEPVSGIPAHFFGYCPDGFDDEIDVTVVSVRLRPDSLVMFYHATDDRSTFNYYPAGLRAVMLDGTEIDLLPSAYGRISEDPDSLSWMECATEVFSVDEIDYILLADETKLTVP